jgi:hypothetical protein
LVFVVGVGVDVQGVRRRRVAYLGKCCDAQTRECVGDLAACLLACWLRDKIDARAVRTTP